MSLAKSVKKYPLRGGISEATTGFEPVIRVLQTLAFPLGHVAKLKIELRPRLLIEGYQSAINVYLSLILSGRWDSNPRPSPWQGDVLPTELHPHCRPHSQTERCRDPESNWGHRDFQSRALPTELSRP